MGCAARAYSKHSYVRYLIHSERTRQGGQMPYPGQAVFLGVFGFLRGCRSRVKRLPRRPLVASAVGRRELCEGRSREASSSPGPRRCAS